MLPVLLAAGAVGFRGLGALGVRRFASWRSSAAHAMAVMLVVTASAHFAPGDVTVMPNRADLAAMVPPFVPAPEAMVAATGVLELFGAVGLVIPRTRRVSALLLAGLFVALLPANVYAAVAEVPFSGEPPTPLVPRVLEQALYVAVALGIAGRASSASKAPEREPAVVR